MKQPDYLSQRKTERLEALIHIYTVKTFLLHLPHEHNQTPPQKTIAIALVSGWVGQGKVAVRFVGQQDKLWHVYTYPDPTRYLETREDPT